MQKDWKKSWVILPHISRRKKSVTFYHSRRTSSWSSKFFPHFCQPNSRALARPSASARSEKCCMFFWYVFMRFSWWFFSGYGKICISNLWCCQSWEPNPQVGVGLFLNGGGTVGSENTVGKMLTNGGGLKIPLKTFFAMNSELEIFFNEISTQNCFWKVFAMKSALDFFSNFFAIKSTLKFFFELFF